MFRCSGVQSFRGSVAGVQILHKNVFGVPAIVEYELRYGLLRWPQQAREARLAALSQLLRPMQMLPFDSECAAFAARIGVELEALSTPIGPHDTLIAATTLRHQATLVARNVREFARVPGLQWQNWHDA